LHPVLDVRGLSKRFGSLEVTRHVTFRLEEGARCALIGPNGAGKTTFINLIGGRVKPGAGETVHDAPPVQTPGRRSDP